jgi:hypothetical protein
LFKVILAVCNPFIRDFEIYKESRDLSYYIGYLTYIERISGSFGSSLNDGCNIKQLSVDD